MAVAIVFSKAQGIVRRMIYQDHPETVDMDNHFVAEGEDYLIVNPENPIMQDDAQRIVNEHRGRPPTSDRCCLVVDGKIVDVLHADPFVDKHPKGRIIQDDHAKVGWFHENDELNP